MCIYRDVMYMFKYLKDVGNNAISSLFIKKLTGLIPMVPTPCI